MIDKGVDNYYSPVNLLEARDRVNWQNSLAGPVAKPLSQSHYQSRRTSTIGSIIEPCKASHYPLGLQIKETQQQRRLETFEKYKHLWHKYEEGVAKHFDKKEEILTGRRTKDE